MTNNTLTTIKQLVMTDRLHDYDTIKKIFAFIVDSLETNGL